MKKIAKYVLTLASLFALASCGTDAEPLEISSENSSNPPSSETSSGSTTSEVSSSEQTTSSEQTSSVSETSSEQETSSIVDTTNTTDTTNTNTNTPPSGNRTEAATFVHDLNVDVADPARAILGDDSTPSPTMSRVKRAITNEDNSDFMDIRRLVDGVGGTYQEEETYCSWANLGTAYDDIADRIISSCEGFSDPLEMIDMFKDFIPDDIQFGQAKATTIQYPMGPNPEDVMEIPMKFYINKTNNDFAFALYYNVMGTEQYMLIEAETIANNKVQYTFKSYGPSRCDYLGLKLTPTSDPHGYYRMYWNGSNQEYYYYNYTHEVFKVESFGSHYQLPVTLIDNSLNYLSINNVTGLITNTTGSPLDIYVYDNGDGTVNLKATPASGSTNPTSGGETQRWVTADYCEVSTWVDGEFYERVGAFDIPAYAMGTSMSSFFKAYKDNDEHWRIYRSFGYGGNECFATQDEKGWYMLYDCGRDENGDLSSAGCKIGYLDGAEIGEYGQGRGTVIKLNSFAGFDEIRAAKEDTRLICPLWVNGVMVDTYYTANNNCDLYKNGVRILESDYHEDLDTHDSISISIDASSRGYKFRTFDSNCSIYGAILHLTSQIGHTNFTPTAVKTLLDDAGLTLKYNNGDFKAYLDKAQDVMDNFATYASEFDYYHIPQRQSCYEFYQNIENNVIPAIDCTGEFLTFFAV